MVTVDVTRHHVRAQNEWRSTDIRELSTQLSALTTARELAVSRALAAGATWAELAQVLGCSPQAAHKRYRWLRHSEVTGEVWRESPLRF